MGSISANQCRKRFVLKIQKGQMDFVWFWFRGLQITTRTCKMSFRAACLSVSPSVPHFLDKKHSVAVNCEDRTLVYKKFSFNLIRGLFFFFFWWYNLEVKKGLLFQMTKQWFNCTIALSIVANKMQDWCPEKIIFFPLFVYIFCVHFSQMSSWVEFRGTINSHEHWAAIIDFARNPISCRILQFMLYSKMKYILSE